MMAEEAAYVEALEIDEAAAGMAARSVLLNGLGGKIRVRRGDYRNIRAIVPPESFDAVIANPPYGGTEEGPSAKGAKAAARQEITATLSDVVRAARYALRYHGKFAMIHRPKRMQFVEPRAGKSANLVLIEAMQGGAAGGLVVLPTLRVYGEGGEYTPELLEIYGKNRVES